jgi:hypothetical protein
MGEKEREFLISVCRLPFAVSSTHLSGARTLVLALPGDPRTKPGQLLAQGLDLANTTTFLMSILTNERVSVTVTVTVSVSV